MDSQVLEMIDYRSIPGWFHWEDLYRRAVERAPILTGSSWFVEVGSHFGKSTRFLADEVFKSGKPIKIWAVDLWDKSSRFGAGLEDFKKNLAPYIEMDMVVPLQGDSVYTAARFLDESVSFVWIDGDHNAPNPLRDIQAWWPKLRKGGWMGGDDVNCYGVESAVIEYFGPECSRVHPTGKWIRYQSANVFYRFEDGSNYRPNHRLTCWWAGDKR